MARSEVSLPDPLRNDVKLPSVASIVRPGPRWHLVVLVAIAVASLILRLDIARNTSLWLDEMYTLRDVKRGLFRFIVGPNPDHPALVYVATKLGMLVFGESEAAVRSASLAFGTATLGAVYLLARELAFSRVRALFAVATFSLAPLFVRHAVEARHYAALMLFTSLSLLAVLRIEREPERKRHYLLLVGSTLATLFTHYYGATSIAATYASLAYVTLAAFRRGDAARMSLLRGFALTAGPVFVAGLAIALLRFARIANHYGVGDNDPSPSSIVAILLQLLREFSPLHASPWIAYAAAFFSLFGLVNVLRQRPAAAIAMLTALLLPLAGLAAVANGISLRPRYAVATFVVYHLLFISGLCSAIEAGARLAARRVSQRTIFRVHPGIAASIVLSVLVGARLLQFPAGYSAGKFHYRGLRDYINADAGKTALACYVGFVCQKVMSGRYAITPRTIGLERFRRLPGVQRYLVAEFHIDASREKRFLKLLKRHFSLDRKAWEALPLVELPSTRYQPAVRARLIELRDVTERPKKSRRKKNRAGPERPAPATGAL